MALKKQHPIIINSKRRLFDLNLKEVWEYRDLIWLMAKRDFTVSYKQTLLGPLWAVIKPVLSSIIFMLVFGGLAGLASTDIPGDYVLPKPLFYLSGTVLWGYFSTVFSACSVVFIANRATMSKVYYPRLVAPIAKMVYGLIPFAISFALMLILEIYYIIAGGTSVAFTPWLLMLVPAILQTGLFALGFGIIVSAATTKYRDLGQLVSFGTQVLNYASPIAYGLESIMSVIPGLLGIYMLNPLSPIMTTFRYAMFGFGYFDLGQYLLGWAITLVVLVIGVAMFGFVEKTFTDTV